jgi:hypothetical protein
MRGREGEAECLPITFAKDLPSCGGHRNWIQLLYVELLEELRLANDVKTFSIINIANAIHISII